ECVVHVFAQPGIACPGAGQRSHGREAVRSPGLSFRQVGRVTLRNGEIVPVHVVVDHKLFPVSADESAHPVLLVSANADLVALVLVLYAVVPIAYWRIALQRLARQPREGEVWGPRSD